MTLRELKDQIVKDCIPTDNLDVVQHAQRAGIIAALNRLYELDLLKLDEDFPERPECDFGTYK